FPPSVTLFLRTPPSSSTLCSLSLHDALPIYVAKHVFGHDHIELRSVRDEAHGGRVDELVIEFHIGKFFADLVGNFAPETGRLEEDRKSTRLNSSHVKISYAVFCLKKKTEDNQ